MSKLDHLRRLDLVGLQAPEPRTPGPPIRLDEVGGPQDWPLELKRGWLEAFGSLPWHRPPGNEAGLKATIADQHGLSPDNVVLFSSPEQALMGLLTAWGWQGRITYPAPTRPLYARVAQVLGIRPIAVLSQADFSLPVDQLVGVARQQAASAVLIANPGDPSGALIAREEILAIVREVAALVVVDEGQLALEGFTLADAVAEHENLVVLQGLGPATRAEAFEVAWLLASAPVVAEVSKVPGADRLSAAACLGARWALNHLDVLAIPAAQLAGRREALRAGLADLDGVVTWPSVAHYMLVGTTMPGVELAERLRRHGIAVQAFTRSPLKTCIRVTVGTDTENAVFLRAMACEFPPARAP